MNDLLPFAQPAMLRLLFTTSNDPVSWVIRKLTGGRVSHVGIQIGPDRVLSAELRGVVEQPVAKFMSGRRLVAAYTATSRGLLILDVNHAVACVGDKYDLDGLPGVLWAKLIWRWLRLKVKNPLADDREYWCSELAFQLDPMLRVPEFVGADPEEESPQDLLDRLTKGGTTFSQLSLTYTRDGGLLIA